MSQYLEFLEQPTNADRENTLPSIDWVAAREHRRWVEEKRAAGVTTRPSSLTGQEQLVDWEDLHEVDKESNRAQVRGVMASVEAWQRGER